MNLKNIMLRKEARHKRVFAESYHLCAVWVQEKQIYIIRNHNSDK